jgi:hypothetical protein
MSSTPSPDRGGDLERVRIEFRYPDAFDPDDRIARYVTRISIALGDLRIAGTYVTRPEQPAHERMYFMRLTASHIHEVCVLFNPPDEAIPRIEDFIAAVADQDDKGAEELRTLHKRVQRALQQPVKVPGKPRLGSEISRIRNAFSHYFNRTEHEPLLTAAMRLAGNIDGNLAYVIRERTMRAEYADEVVNKIVYPWPSLSDEDWIAAARALQERIVALIDPLTSFLHHAEAAFLARWARNPCPMPGPSTASLPLGPSRGELPG